jgi:lysyl-tRNA synthetase class 2
VRLAKPGSPWARWRYGARASRKQALAEQRFAPDRRTERLKERFRDAIGGTTSDVFEAKQADRAARAQASAELRRRADRVAAGEGRQKPPAGP